MTKAWLPGASEMSVFDNYGKLALKPVAHARSQTRTLWLQPLLSMWWQGKCIKAIGLGMLGLSMPELACVNGTYIETKHDW